MQALGRSIGRMVVVSSRCHFHFVSTAAYVIPLNSRACFRSSSEMPPVILPSASLANTHPSHPFLQVRTAEPQTHRHFGTLLDPDLGKHHVLDTTLRHEPCCTAVDMSLFSADHGQYSRHFLSLQNSLEIVSGIVRRELRSQNAASDGVPGNIHSSPGEGLSGQQKLNVTGDPVTR